MENTKISFKAKNTDIIIDIDKELNCIFIHNLFVFNSCVYQMPVCVPIIDDEITTIQSIIKDFSKLIDSSDLYFKGFVLGSGYNDSFVATIYREIEPFSNSIDVMLILAVFMRYSYDKNIGAVKKKIYKSDYYDYKYIQKIINDLNYIIESIKCTKEISYMPDTDKYEIEASINYPISIDVGSESKQILQDKIDDIINLLKEKKNQLPDTVIDLIKELLDGTN